VEGSCKLGNEPSGSIKCWKLPNGCTTCGLSCGTRLHIVSWVVPKLINISQQHIEFFLGIRQEATQEAVDKQTAIPVITSQP
jgi:hypothetical protein